MSKVFNKSENEVSEATETDRSNCEKATEHNKDNEVS